MSVPLSVADIARTTDETAVRLRYDIRNRIWMGFLLLGFLLPGIIRLGILSREGGAGFIAANIHVWMVVLGLVVVRDVFRLRRGRKALTRRVASFADARISVLSAAFMAALYLVLLIENFADGSWIWWALVMTVATLGFRLFTNELLLLYGFYLAAGIVVLILRSLPAEKFVPVLTLLVVFNVIGFFVAANMSGRMRREVVADWSERRVHAIEQLRMRDELQYARDLQLLMLPDSEPDLGWIEVAGSSQPATEVGGDYFDYIVKDDRVAVVCADVAGHGLPSGIVLSAIRTGLMLLRDLIDDPTAVLQRLHDLVQQTSRKRLLVTMAIAVVERPSLRVTVASAGHPPALLRRASGVVTQLTLEAPPLGVRLPFQVAQLQLTLAPGDILMMYTDGVFEARGEGDPFGMDRLERIVAEQGNGSAASLRDAVLTELERFRAGSPLADDATVVVARVVG